jgi:hypothetical protein
MFHLFGLHLSFLIFLACLILPQRMRSNRSGRAAMMMMMVVVVMMAYIQQGSIQLFRRPYFVSTPGDREILRQLVLLLQLLLDAQRASLRPPMLLDELASRRLTVMRSDFSSLHSF